MDRNFVLTPNIKPKQVALHPEGVDRNIQANARWVTDKVALHPEGVDRNHVARLADRLYHVALHPEGVDRNLFGYDIANLDRGSPSTRRAWREMRVRWDKV